MALHEEAERRAMQGELAELERAWREAEEIAKIADNLSMRDAKGRGLRSVAAVGCGGYAQASAMKPPPSASHGRIDVRR